MDYTRFTNIEVGEVKAQTVKGTPANQKSLNAQSVEMSVDTTLTDAQKNSLAVLFTCSAASKALTLGLEDGQIMFVANIGGTNAVTVKAISGDSGTSVAAGKVAIVVASKTANASKIYVLN